MNNINKIISFTFIRVNLMKTVTMFLIVGIVSVGFSRTICTGIINPREVPDCNWYGQYQSREKISDPLDLPLPSQTSVDSWKKKFLSVPFPPRYKKPLQTKDDHDVWNELSSHYKHLLYFREKLEIAYIEYRRYGLDVTEINNVCGQLSAATQVKAWKDSWERTTRVRNLAREELQKTIRSVGVAVDKLFESLVIIKQKEFDAWTRNHPQEAMSIMMKRRIEDAERRAENAECNAWNAAARADAAEARANAAEARAVSAELNAADAAQRASDAERKIINARW